MNKKYGILLGRFQPFHNGHFENIQEIIREGFEPIIIIGSKTTRDERNPLSFHERKKQILEIYPNVKIFGVEDHMSYDNWIAEIEFVLSEYKKEDLYFFTHKKESDFSDFKCKGKNYKNQHYSKCLEDSGFKIIDTHNKVCPVGFSIDSTKIRKCKDYAFTVLDARIFKRLEELDFWDGTTLKKQVLYEENGYAEYKPCSKHYAHFSYFKNEDETFDIFCTHGGWSTTVDAYGLTVADDVFDVGVQLVTSVTKDKVFNWKKNR